MRRRTVKKEMWIAGGVAGIAAAILAVSYYD